MQLEQAVHGDDEDVGKVVRDRLVEVAEVVGPSVDRCDVGRQRKERRRLDSLRKDKTQERGQFSMILWSS